LAADWRLSNGNSGESSWQAAVRFVDLSQAP
jgi:hypothetical protein